MRATRLAYLYFINGTVPTDDDYAAAQAIERRDHAHVKFRNGQTPSTGAPEACDKVCGPSIPAIYSAKYPTVDAEGNEHEPAAFPIGTEATTGGAEVSEPSALAKEVGSVGGWGS